MTQARVFHYHPEISPPPTTRASPGRSRRQRTVLFCLSSECSPTGSLGSEVYLSMVSPWVRGGCRGGESGEDSKLCHFHTLQLGGEVQAHHSSWLWIKRKKTESKITTHLPSPHLWFTEPFYWSGLRTACAHPSLGQKAAFPCVVSSLYFPLPSSPSPYPSRLCSCPSLMVDILYTVLKIMFNKLSKIDSTRREMYLRFSYRLRNLEANVAKISVQYIDHWIQWPPNLPSCRPLVVLLRVVSIEWWGETP